jgi:hypothetical protein
MGVIKLSRKTFMLAIRKAGAIRVKQLIRMGKIKKDELVDMDKEVDSMMHALLKSEATAAAMGTLGITNADLEEVLRDICDKAGLKVKE